MPTFIGVNVLSRSSSTDKLLPRPFRVRSRQGAPSESFEQVKVTRATPTQGRRRAAGFAAELDCTTYNCGCGFVFQAAVLTSVACPHCGDSQAW